MHNLVTQCLKIGLFLSPFLSVNAGSYLYCVNPNIKGSNSWKEYKTNPWGWATGKNIELNSSLEKNLDQYKDFTYRTSNGVWISGTVSYANYQGVFIIERHHLDYGKKYFDSAYQAFLLVNYIFNTKDQAINYCKTIQNICKNDYGQNYSDVGVSSWDIPQSTWGNVLVGYKGGWISCPQMNYRGYMNIAYVPISRTIGQGLAGVSMMIPVILVNGVVVIGMSFFGFLSGMTYSYEIVDSLIRENEDSWKTDFFPN